MMTHYVFSKQSNMDRWEGKVAIVTGASAGIGAAITKELVQAGLVVVGLARRLEKLEELSASLKKAKGKLHARKCDIANEKDLLDAFKWVNTQLGGPDILVNNAGVLKVTRFLDDTNESYRQILNVNVLATAIAIREAVTSMKSRQIAGHIININSTFGHIIPNPDICAASIYTSTKHAITALTETVRTELATDPKNKIKITSLSPGAVRTEIMDSGGHSGDDFYAAVPPIEAKYIADSVLFVLGTPENVQVTELTIRPINEII